MPDTSKDLLNVIVQAADDRLAEDIVALDVRGISILADYFLVMHGSSVRQNAAIADSIIEEVEKAGFEVKQLEGKDSAEWILIDCRDVIVHIFTEENRDYYQIERLWSDAPQVDLDLSPSSTHFFGDEE